jgi:hypothetical protein
LFYHDNDAVTVAGVDGDGGQGQGVVLLGGATTTGAPGSITILGGEAQAGTEDGGSVTIAGGESAGGAGGGINFNIAGDVAWVIDGTTGNFVREGNGGVFVISPMSVAELPTCDGSTEGGRLSVEDSNAVSFTAGIGAVVAGGGSTHVPVYCDGTNWLIG